MKHLIFLILLSATLCAQSADWQTDYEKSDFLETPRYDQTIEYCQRLADASPWISYTSFGISPQGRDLPLLIIDRNGNFTPEAVRASGNVVVYIQAGIHAGEPDGKDAGLMLVREIAVTKKLDDLIGHVTILFNPIFNVDGHERFSAYNRINQNGPEETGWRVTAQNYNLNRDYLKADAPEMKAFLRLYNRWLPEFFADCHVTDGADYQYAVSYKLDTHGIADDGLIDWTENYYLKNIKSAMAKSGFPLNPYVAFRKAHDVKSGLADWASPPRLSDGYVAAQNRIGLLIETHMFKDYKTRVTATYELLKNTLRLVNKDYRNLKTITVNADSVTSQWEFRQKPFALTYKYAKDSTMIDFKGFKYTVEKSDLTGGDWYRYSADTISYKIPHFNKMEANVTVMLPDAYIIPVEWTEVIDRLELHAINYRRLQESVKMTVETYRFSDLSWAKKPYEGRFPLKFDLEPVNEEMIFPAGSVVIDMNQRAAKIVANILEPRGRDSYLYWGFFNSIFERKEYSESYVMEERARIMLASDEELRNEFNFKIETDSSFAGDTYAILLWFYQKSPYWDQRINLYPVGRIMNRREIENIQFRR